jgi:hypothetical protein
MRKLRRLGSERGCVFNKRSVVCVGCEATSLDPHTQLRSKNAGINHTSTLGSTRSACWRVDRSAVRVNREVA